MATVLALFIGNITATMEGAKRMVDVSEHKLTIIKQWFYVFVIVTIGGPLGWYLEKPLNPEQLSMIISFAADALMAFITEELITSSIQKSRTSYWAISLFWFYYSIGFIPLSLAN